jgi:hypothetical protein
MVGIDKISPIPPARPDGLIGFPARIRRPGADNGMFPVRFVPNRGNFDALLSCLNYRCKLGLSLSPEPVPYPE